MGRGKWKRLTKKGKDALVMKTHELKIKLTDIENNWEKIYDLEESINDNIKNLFECNAECTTCNEKDRAACMLNFRKANVFYLQKIRSYEEFFYDAVQYLGNFIQIIQQVFIEGKDIEDLDLEEDDKKDLDKPEPVTMFS